MFVSCRRKKIEILSKLNAFLFDGIFFSGVWVVELLINFFGDFFNGFEGWGEGGRPCFNGKVIEKKFRKL